MSPLLQVLAAVVVAALVFFVYWPSIHGPFLFDDLDRIQENTHIRLTTLSLAGLLDAGFGGPAASRPIAMMSFALNYYFHGPTTTGFHVVNVGIHLLSGFVFYYFVTLTLRLRPLREYASRSQEIAFFAAAIWLLHPLATQSVAYLVQRMTALSGLFYMVALVAYVRGRLAAKGIGRWAWFAGCALSAVLALGSKEIAITLPVVILLYEWYFLQDLSRAWFERVSPALALVALAGVVGLFWMAPWTGYSIYPFTLGQRLMTEARVVVYYLTLIALPHPSRLSADYAFPVSTSLLAPATTFLSILGIAGLVALAWATAKTHRLVSFVILWYLGNLVLESTVIPLDLVFEHRTYLPSMGVVLIAVAWVCRSVTGPWLRVGGLTAVVLVLSMWTYQRSAVWNDPLVLWQDTVSKQPNLTRARYNRAVTAQGRADTKQAAGDYRGAIADYDRLIAQEPNNSVAYINRGAARSAQNDYQGAIADLTKAIELNPRSADALTNRGNARRSVGDMPGALSDFSKAIEINPRHEVSYLNRAVARHSMNDYPGAIADYTALLGINPKSAMAVFNRGHAKLAVQDTKGACEDFRASVQLGYPGADANLKKYCGSQ